MQMSEAAITGLIALHFPASEVESGKRVSWRESNWDPTVHNDYQNGGDPDDDSYGLFQINMKGNLGVERRRRYGILVNSMLYEPNFNVSIARKIWDDNGNSWTGSAAWGSIPASRNYPSGGSGGGTPAGPALTAAEQAIWDALPQAAKDFYTNLRKNSPNGVYPGMQPIPRTNGAQTFTLTDEQYAVVQKWWMSQPDPGVPEGDDFEFNLPDFPSIPGLGWTEALGKFFSIITSAEFWKRIGLGALGIGIVVVAVIFFGKDAIKGQLT